MRPFWGNLRHLGDQSISTFLSVSTCFGLGTERHVLRDLQCTKM